MTPVAPEAVTFAVRVLGTDGLSVDDVESRVLESVGSKELARRLIDWIPEAFGIVLVSHLGAVILPTT